MEILIKKEANKNFKGGIFKGIPNSGDLIKKKGVTCNIPLDRYLPQNWLRFEE